MDLRHKALEALAQAGRTVRGELSRRALHPVPGEGPGWRPAEIQKLSPRGVFAGSRWFEVKAWSEGALRLVWEDAGQSVALLSIRDVWIPGVQRRWEVVVEPEPLGAAVDQAELLQGLFRLAAHNGVDEVTSRFNMARWTASGLEDLLSESEREAFGTYVVDLAPEPEALRAGLHKKHRYQLTKAEKAGVEIRTDIDADAFVALMEETYERGGKSLSYTPRYLRRVVAAAASLPCLTVGAWAQERWQAVLLIPYDRRRGYFLHGASAASPVMGASVLAHVAAMERLRELGVAAYDLGGARAATVDPRLQGIFRFKKRFGGVFEPCWRWSKKM